MKPKERVMQALNHRESDICPYYIWIHEEMMEPIGKYYENSDFKENYIIDHSVMREITARESPTAENEFIDEFGVRWKQGAVIHADKPVLDGPDLKNYVFPDLTTPEHYEGLDAWLDRYSDRFKIVQLGMLFFERTWNIRGFELFLTDLYDNPRFAHDLLDGLEILCSRIIDYLLKNFGDKIDAIGLSDDYGSEKNLLLSPGLWREFLAPRLKGMYKRIHEGGKYVYLHSCGHVESLVPDFIDLGVDILQPIQPEANNIFRLKERYGDRICLMGGISTQKTLPFGTPEQIAEEVSVCLEVMARGGGYVMAPAKPILPGVPLENAVALIDAVVNQ